MPKTLNFKLILLLFFIGIVILHFTNAEVEGEAQQQEEDSTSFIIIVNLDDPLKKWDSLSIQLYFIPKNSFQRSYVVWPNSKPENITIMVEASSYSHVKFGITVESQWWMTDFYRLSNSNNYYRLERGKTIILDLKYEIYANRMREIASELELKISRLVGEGFAPAYTIPVVEHMVEEGISYARVGDYLAALTCYRKLLMAKNTVEEQITRLTLFAPVSLIILYTNSVFFAIFIGSLTFESRSMKIVIAMVTFSLSWILFVSFAPDMKFLVFSIIPENRFSSTLTYLFLSILTFSFSIFLAEKAKDSAGIRKLSSITTLAIRDIRSKAFRYASLIITISLVIGSLVFLLTLGTAYVRDLRTVMVMHDLNAIIIESPIGVLDEDYSWIASLPAVVGISQVFIDDTVVGLPPQETAIVREHGYFFLVNLKNESIKADMACRIFLNRVAMDEIYRLSEMLVGGRCPLNENEVLLCYDKARSLNVNLGDEVAYYGYIPHAGHRILGAYTVVGLLNSEMLVKVKELNGGNLLKINERNPYGNYSFNDVMICVWNGQTPITRLSVLFNGSINSAELEDLSESLALSRIRQRYTVWLVQNRTAFGISYSESLFVHGLADAVVPLSLSMLLSFMITFEMLNEKASDLRTLAILGLNPTDLKRLILIQLILAESAAGFIGYVIGTILFPLSTGTYLKSGVSYQAIVMAFIILTSLLGGYIPASKVYSRTTPSLTYRWKPLEDITREGITHRLPLMVQPDEIQKLDEFLRKRLPSAMELENPNIKVEAKHPRNKPEGKLYYFYQVSYNLFPFDMSIMVHKETAHLALQVHVKRNTFVSADHYRMILECVRKTILRYNIERQ
ncbi:MAG: hypothetical protein FGF48_08905 [Candidatus Brockarchaeota archaeon]|nr:hypothetical protein [Candidatus Brockarchaeota archaeon]